MATMTDPMSDEKLYSLKCLEEFTFCLTAERPYDGEEKDIVHAISSWKISDEEDDDDDEEGVNPAGSDLLSAKGGGSYKVQSDYLPDTAREDWSKYLPKIFLSNVQSIKNKKKEFQELMEGNEEYKACDLVCLTETWLQEKSKDIFKSFKVTFRRDRDLEKTDKSKGGGLSVSGNGRLKRLKGYSLKNHELMTFSYKADDHPENYPPIIFMLVYLSGDPGVAGEEQIKEKIKQRYQYYLKEYKSGPVFLLGDFNKYGFLDLPATTDATGPNARMVQQYVMCPTRKGAILDKCYGNVKDAYICQNREPLGKSDHNVILLIPPTQVVEEVKKRLPMKTDEDLNNVEVLLKDRAAITALAEHLASPNVCNPRDDCKDNVSKLQEMMSVVLDNSLAKNFDWSENTTNGSGRRAFRDLNITAALTGAAARLSEDESEMVMTNWLNNKK